MESSSMKKLSENCRKKLSENCPLPEELLFYEILPRLPMKSLIRFKSVSKTWLSRIFQDSFLIARKHAAGEQPGTLIHLPYDEANEGRIGRLFFLAHNESNLIEMDTSYMRERKPDPTQTVIELIGSCNGLVCLRMLYLHEVLPLVLWNPATREVNYLPAAAVTPGCNERYAGYALGFDARTRVHKVVRLEVVKPGDDLVNVNAQIIFSNKSGRWRDLNSLTGISPTYSFTDGLTVDGAIYWTIDTTLYFPNPCTVLSFDLSKEEFREFDGPPCRADDGHITDFFDLDLINWKGSLGAVFVKPGGTEIQFFLKNKDSKNSDNGWKHISTIEPSLGPVSLGGVFRDQIILICPDETSSLVLYDLVTKEKREFERELEAALRKVNHYQIFDHFHSLISPN